MIIVSGATGQLGRLIVQRLLKSVSAERVGVSVRDRSKAADLAALGVRVRSGDFEDAAGLRHAFEGSTQVLMVSSNARANGGNPIAQHQNAINAAKAVGARRIVYTSQIAAKPRSLFGPMADHVATESMLAESGLAWTALRNGFYAASALQLMGDALKSGTLATPADGRVSWTAHADLAEAAAIILAKEGTFDGPTPPLTGAEALDMDDLAAIASELTGKPMKRKTISDDEVRTTMAERKAPPQAAEIYFGLFAAARAGEFATVDPTLERLLGRRPTAMRDVIAQKVKS